MYPFPPPPSTFSYIQGNLKKCLPPLNSKKKKKKIKVHPKNTLSHTDIVKKITPAEPLPTPPQPLHNEKNI